MYYEYASTAKQVSTFLKTALTSAILELFFYASSLDVKKKIEENNITISVETETSVNEERYGTEKNFKNIYREKFQ